MNGLERFQRAVGLFRVAHKLPLDERSAFLATECLDETTLREEVEGMLRADAKPSGVLDAAARVEGMSIADFVLTRRSAERPLPKRIGGYEIVRVLGAGGMGVVYEARQENPRRSVALKVMHAGLVSSRALQRFQHEAQVLGRLQDPGIAQVFEAGIDDWGEGSQPYFAMELVDGKPLLEFVKQAGIGARERLALLAKICDIVHAAHQKGVIHRDLKPANILVIERDSDDAESSGSSSHDFIAAQPKILDFGVARVLDPDHVATLQTNAGQILGTVPYMSPEQASGDSASIDTRSDVYSLGVIAFEVLSGALPHDVRHKPLHEALHIIGTEEAPRLGGVDRELRGDIETVVAKALEKSPARRYASAAEMAADLRRILRHESIQARRPSVIDQVVKLARRNRGIVAAALLAVAALIAVTIVSLRLASVATQAGIDERNLRGVADARSAEITRQSYRLALSAAASSLRFFEVNDARRHLESAPTELRGWEWQHLLSRLDDSLASIAGPRLGAPIAFSPDGSALVVATEGGTVHRWHVGDVARDGADALTNRLDATIAGGFRDKFARRISFAADGETASVLTRGGITLVDGRTLATLDQRRLPTDVFAASSDGWIATTVVVNSKRALSVQRGADERLDLPGLPVSSIDDVAAFSSDNRLVAVCDGTSAGLAVFDLASRQRLIHRPEITVTKALGFSADGSLLAVALGTRALLLRTDGTGTEIALEGHLSGITTLALSGDGRLVATASNDHTVRVWSAETGHCRSVMLGDELPVSGIAFAPDGSLLATVRSDGVIRLWSASEQADPFVFDAPSSVYGIAFSRDGARIASGSLGGDRPVRVWDSRSGAPVAAYGEGYISCVAFDADAQRVAFGRAHGDITIARAVDGAPLATLRGHWWRTDWIDFMPDGEKLVSIGNSSSLLLDDATTGERVLSRRISKQTSNLGARARLSPNGSLLVASIDNDAALLEPSTFIEQGRLVGHSGPIRAIAFSADGARVATGSDDHSVRIWDVKTRTCLGVLVGHADGVYAVAFSPDGRRIASGGNDRVVRIWDADLFDELISLRGHESFVYCLEFSPDGRCLVSGGGDATIRWWDTRPFREVVAARSR